MPPLAWSSLPDPALHHLCNCCNHLYPSCVQIYDYIDRHITKLDKDCKAFDAGAPLGRAAGHAAAGHRLASGHLWRGHLSAPNSHLSSWLPAPHCTIIYHPAEIAKERQRLGLPPVEPTVGGGSVDTATGKRKGRKDGGGEQRKLTPEEQYQVGP